MRDVSVYDVQDCHVIPGHSWHHSKGWVNKNEPRKWEVELKRYPTHETRHNKEGNRTEVSAGHSTSACWALSLYHMLCLLLELESLMEHSACHSLQSMGHREI